jgi:putative ABC transport system ATP-binding protein
MDMGTEESVVVRCRGLTKSYGEGMARVEALRGIDLDVKGGELLMIVGPSGCGKTTLISIITAILEQNAGVCEVLGQETLKMEPAARIKLRAEDIGFVFQSFNLLPALTALENVSVPLLINGMKRHEAEAKAREVLETVGLGERLTAAVTQLSGGQQQRVAIARALVHNPRLVVCDEPTSNLDHRTGHEVMNVLRDRARKEGRALIVVTHDSRIFEYADRFARMEDGRIIEVLEASERGQLQ